MALEDFLQKERWMYCLRHGWTPEPHNCEEFNATRKEGKAI